MFVGLNPSTADETEDDQTIRRCVGFAMDWGYGGLCMGNLFAIRATKPKNMLIHPSPIGPENNAWLKHLSLQSDKVIAAWGTNGGHMERNREVIEILPNLMCLEKTKAGYPKHPLYVKKDISPQKYP